MNSPGNSPQDRNRRRLQATTQSLIDAISGVNHFEIRTVDPETRALGAGIIRAALRHLEERLAKLEAPLE
jgi:hypothetical protein